MTTRTKQVIKKKGKNIIINKKGGTRRLLERTGRKRQGEARRGEDQTKREGPKVDCLPEKDGYAEA